MSGSTSNNNYIGSGSDTITLSMAEDQALGTDAQFTVNVDGKQIGGVQTVTASQSAGQTEGFTFAGDWAPGQHNVTVTFVNNFLYPGSSGDRNVFIHGVTYDGQTVSSSTTPIYESALFPPNSLEGNVYGNATFTVNDTTAASAPPPDSTPGPVTIGSGSDTLVLNMAEDPYQGDAQFTVAVDGQQIGGVQTTTAVVAQGQTQEFDVKGNFGGGTHSVAVTFLNDFIGGYYPDGTPGLPPGGPWAIDTEDRNLYVMGASLNGGTPASGAPWEQSGDGTHTYSVTAGSNPSATGASSGLFGSDGAAATSNNIAIPTSALSAQSSSSGMSFIATPTTADTSTTTTASTTGSSGSTTSTPAASVASAAPTTQDFAVTTTPSATDTTTSTAGSGTSTMAASIVAATTTTHHHHHNA